MSINAKHGARIHAVLRLLVELDPARQMVVLEDAYVACSLGLACGFTMPQLVNNAADCIDEVVKENATASPSGDQTH